jgi:tRNA-dihydrouridine synthase
MEDVTDPAFRALCKRYGADRVYTEFVNADALVRDIASTTRKLTIHDAERPVAIQIYGREPEAMADAARIVEQAHPDFIDINFGCPVKKVAGKGAGAGLLRDVPKMLEITRAVVNAVHTPVTAKTRLGWDESDLLPRVNPLGLNRSVSVSGLSASAVCQRSGLSAQRSIIIMGNEGNGISQRVRELVTHPIRIPSYPKNAETSESLNVSIATAIVLAEFRRTANS